MYIPFTEPVLFGVSSHVFSYKYILNSFLWSLLLASTKQDVGSGLTHANCHACHFPSFLPTNAGIRFLTIWRWRLGWCKLTAQLTVQQRRCMPTLVYSCWTPDLLLPPINGVKIFATYSTRSESRTSICSVCFQRFPSEFGWHFFVSCLCYCSRISLLYSLCPVLGCIACCVL